MADVGRRSSARSGRAGPGQRAGPDAAQADGAGRARHLPGHRAVGPQPGRPRQPPAGRLRPAASVAGHGGIAGARRRCAPRSPTPTTGRAQAARGPRGAAPAPPAAVGVRAGRRGAYGPMSFAGTAAAHAVGYARGPASTPDAPAVAVVVPRLVLGLAAAGGWGDTTVGAAARSLDGRAHGRHLGGPRVGRCRRTRAPRRPPRRLSRRPAGAQAVTHRLGSTGVTVSVWAPRARDSVEVDAGGRRRGPAPAASGGSGPATCPASGRAPTTPSRSTAAPRGPTPARRASPTASTGPSRLVDHAAFPWTDEGWTGVDLAAAVLYELHVGTFSPEGTFDGAVDHLDHLVALGVTAVELMPVAEFPGRRGLGLRRRRPVRAPPRLRGPDGLKRLVDACHARGLGVVLDVVYNHLGPAGNHLAELGPYFTDRHPTPWGRAVNLDGPGSDEVRAFVVDNARMWLRRLPRRRPAPRRGARHRRRLGHPRPRAAGHGGRATWRASWGGRCG